MKAKRRHLRLQVDLPPWDHTGFVLTGGTVEEARQFAVAATGIEFTKVEDAAGCTFQQPRKPFVIWVRSISDIPTLAHEALHVVSTLLLDRGVRHSAETEESYCYTLGYLLKMIRNAPRREWRSWRGNGQRGES